MPKGVSRQQRQELRERFARLDPFALKAEAERRSKPILAKAVVPRSPLGGPVPR
jgi:hypothetical protein